MVRWWAEWDGSPPETAAAVLHHNAEGNKGVRRERDTHLPHVDDLVGAREVPASCVFNSRIRLPFGPPAFLISRYISKCAARYSLPAHSK
jgi:hypothetical protein